MNQSEIKKISKMFLTKKFLKKIIAYLLLILFFYLFSDFAFIFFLTFIFSYLFLSFWDYLKWKFDFTIDKIFEKWKVKKILKKLFSLNVIILIEYIIFIAFIVFTLSSVLPKIVDELVSLPDKVPFIKNEVTSIVTKLQDLVVLNTELWWSITEIINTPNMEKVWFVIEKVKSAWFLFLQIILSLILSYIFIVDRDKIKEYFLWIKESNFSFFYHEYADFFERIVKSFWLILKAQAMIALVNTILTTIGLYIIWWMFWMTFPYILTLIIVVFLCWLIPVLGTFLSSIPILFVWYSLVWWFNAVILIILMISIVHFVEAYYLNPKIVSKFLNLPVSLTFVILIVSEHLFGIAWLLLWVSLFYFVEWLLKDADKWIDKLNEK